MMSSINYSVFQFGLTQPNREQFGSAGLNTSDSSFFISSYASNKVFFSCSKDFQSSSDQSEPLSKSWRIRLRPQDWRVQSSLLSRLPTKSVTGLDSSHRLLESSLMTSRLA